MIQTRLQEHEYVYVDELPPCGLCVRVGRATKARYDAKLCLGGAWAYVCGMHFAIYGLGLGTGLGQRLLLFGEEP